jgi:hypothetical protein
MGASGEGRATLSPTGATAGHTGFVGPSPGGRMEASMAIVPAGSRLVLRTDHGTASLRTLRDVELVGQWSVPVLAPLRALEDGDGVLEVGTDTGWFSAAAHLRLADGVLEVCQGASSTPALLQRRQDVRGRMSLPLRAAAVDAAAEQVFADEVVEGVTLDVSAGGVGVDLHPRSGRTPYGSRLYLELSLPQGSLVPAVVAVVELADRRLHGRFVDIAAVDRERLVRMVFEEQRRDLAARARSRDTGGR